MKTIITKKVTLLPAPKPPFVGSILDIQVSDGLMFKLRSVKIADDCEHFVIDWGDGAREVFINDVSDLAHTYPARGNYRISFSDEIESFAIGSPTDSSEYATIYAPMVSCFSSNGSRLTETLTNCFRKCINLTAFEISKSNLNTISGASFKNCYALSGDLYFPCVTTIRGTGATLPFIGCSNITALHFREANMAAIMAASGYSETSPFGAENAICKFDL